MIQLQRMNGSELWLNPLHIESVEQTPDTVVTLANGHKYLVRQSAEELSLMMQSFWQRIGLAGQASSVHDYGGLVQQKENS